MEDTGLQKAGAVASNLASFLLWYPQGNQAQLASPADVILIHRKLLEFCQLEGVVQAGDATCSRAGVFSVTTIRGQSIHADVFHRPAGNVDVILLATPSRGSILSSAEGICEFSATCIPCEPWAPKAFFQHVPVTLINTGTS